MLATTCFSERKPYTRARLCSDIFYLMGIESVHQDRGTKGSWRPGPCAHGNSTGRHRSPSGGESHPPD